jgi:hypothetical protein
VVGTGVLDRFRISADHFLIRYERFRIEINLSALNTKHFLAQTNLFATRTGRFPIRTSRRLAQREHSKIKRQAE